MFNLYLRQTLMSVIGTETERGDTPSETSTWVTDPESGGNVTPTRKCVVGIRSVVGFFVP